MEKKARSRMFNFGKIIIALLLCLFCSLSFSGCVGRSGGGGGGSSSGGSSGSGSGSGSGGSGSGGSEEGGEDTPEDTGPSINNFNDVFLCAIGVYQIDGTEDVFYDKHTGTLVSYNDLVERQFDTMATYIYNTLNRIYGPSQTGASFTVSGFGDAKTIEYGPLISNPDQKIITGFSTGELARKDYLNYTNSISGGYKLNATDNGDETYTLAYDTSVTLTDNAWVGKDYFTKDYIKKTLGYIYTHQQTVAAPNAELTFNSDGVLKNYYANNFVLNNTDIVNFDFKTIDSLGLTNKYIWNVAHYIAFSLIGKNNIEASINNYNTVFTGSNITELNATNFETLPASLERYKGYNIVLADLLSDIMNLNIVPGTNTISITDCTAETTCFPELKKEMYIYYDKIDDLCDANNEDMNAEGGSDEDYDFSDDEDGEDFDESAMDNIDVGTAFKLKKAFLVPKIDISKNNISSFGISGLLLGYQAEEEGTYKVELSIGGLDKDGKEIEPTSISIDGGTNIDGTKVIYDETYKFSEDLVDVSIELGTELSNVEFDGVGDVEAFITNSFRSQTRTVNYASGGSKTIGYGYLNIYNSLIDSNGNFTALKNILELNFDYYSSSGTKLTEIPSTYLMYFYVF